MNIVNNQIIRIGGKVDIQRMSDRSIRQLREEKPQPYYKSKVMDVDKNGIIQILIPIDGGQLILFAEGEISVYAFVTAKGVYKSRGKVTKRYKQGNIYVMNVELLDELEKFQRREYYRMQCLVDINYRPLEKHEERYSLPQEVFLYEQESEVKPEYESGRAINISGGGMKIRTIKRVAPKSKIFLYIMITVSNVMHKVYIIAEVLSCEKNQLTDRVYFDSSIQFKRIEKTDRELIVKFIFEEERRQRKL